MTAAILMGANTTLATLCVELKTDNVEIFTIAFGVTEPKTLDMLRACASGDGNFFDAKDSTRLDDAFKTIGNALTIARLVKRSCAGETAAAGEMRSNGRETIMRILMINPNTSASITDLVVAAARREAAPETQIVGVTGRFGARYISTRAASAIAAHATLDAYGEHGADADVVALACFGDPGLGGLKELAHQPVIGMAEAACLEAARNGRRFAIVTGGERWGPMLEEFVAGLGLASQLAVVKTVSPSGGDIARDPDGSLALLAGAIEACTRDHAADVVILGGAGLAGLTESLALRVATPLIDSVASLVAAAERLGHARPAKPTVGSYAQRRRRNRRPRGPIGRCHGRAERFVMAQVDAGPGVPPRSQAFGFARR